MDFAAPADDIGNQDALGLLWPLEHHVAEFSLARTHVTDGAMDVVGNLLRLTRLDLGGTAVGDAGIARLSGLDSLTELILVGTQVTDASVETLLALPALKRLWTWESGLTEQGVARLRAGRPDLVLDRGDLATGEPLEVEPDLVFTGDAPLLDAPADAAGGPLAAANPACPVSGQPVDPRYAVLFEGRLVGFCCPNCPGKFWADPEAFRDKLE